MKIHPPKVIFQDVDGCLNPPDGEPFGASPEWVPSPAQSAWLERIGAALEAAPVEQMIINTGRFWAVTEPIIKKIETSKLRYCILEHGCLIYDRLEQTFLPVQDLARQYQMDDLVERFQSLVLIDQLTDWFTSEGQIALEKQFNVDLPYLEKAGNLSFEIPSGIDHETMLEAVRQLAAGAFKEADFKRFQFCLSDRFVDILPDIQKIDGVRLMLAHLGLQIEEALMVGDYLNDLSVFEACPRLLCPANAHPRIRKITANKGTPYSTVSPYLFGEAILRFLESSPQSS